MKRACYSAVILMAVILTISSCNKDNTPACPSHYTGANCSQQITPSQVQLSRITITGFPATNNGSAWNTTEGSGYADIYPTISDSAGNVLFNGSASYIPDASSTLSYYFNFSIPIALTPYSTYIFTLYNHNNFSADNNMGAVSTVLYTSTNGFPSTLNLTNGAGLSFQLSIQNVWQ
jgi:hypothetical protein